MRIQVGDELRRICGQILSEKLSEAEWAARESDDMFQSDTYVGGFDATEKAFCFSYHAADGSESWFQLTLDEVQQIARGELLEILARPAE